VTCWNRSGNIFPPFTLSSVIEEIRRWSETGRSCFARCAEKLGLTGRGVADDGRQSLLDRVIPVLDGQAAPHRWGRANAFHAPLKS